VNSVESRRTNPEFLAWRVECGSWHKIKSHPGDGSQRMRLKFKQGFL